MHRLFVAIRPPRATREMLIDLMEGLPGARWQDDEHLHLTLRFIGEVDGHRAEDIAAALGRVAHPPIEVTLSGLGRFGKPGRPRALWVGAEPRAPLKALHEQVNTLLSTVGLEPERRAYLPHVTIARLGSGTAPIDHYLSENAGVALPPFRAEHFGLFESTLSHQGASYAMIARYPLDRADPAAG
ncbi:MAG: RNA 2',3'-cyclic phosphodiesterase [Parasphingopyxis sp.]|nr:RNA 2',3'-cyclic phosphodiesterase [Sphingomonadales bacterium]